MQIFKVEKKKVKTLKYLDREFNLDLTCRVCLLPALEPILHQCGSLYCKACVESNNIYCTICQTLITALTQAPNCLKKKIRFHVNIL